MKAIGKIFHDTLTRVIAATVFLFLTSFAFPQVRQFFGSLNQLIPVPAWAILIWFIISTLAIADTLSRFLTPRYVKKYRTDVIDGVRWRWNYKNRRVVNVQGYCAAPNCDTELILKEFDGSTVGFRGTEYYCTQCNVPKHIHNAMNLPDHERRKIEKKIKDGSWQETLKQ